MHEDYGKALQSNEAVLVIIDIQEKLLPVMSEKDLVATNAAKLVDFANIMKIPIICTEQENLGETIPEVSSRIENFKPIRKIDFSCYYCSEFVNELDKLKKKSLIVAGIESHICVLQTVMHALPQYNVHVIYDSISSRSPHNKELAIERMRTNGAVISSVEMFIFEMLQRAGTDEFRSGRKLIL
jgi:isochorismate hydrolase